MAGRLFWETRRWRSARRTRRSSAADLTAKETAIVDIGAWTARGEQDKLGAAFKAGFDAGLTLNEAKELVGQLYAYCWFQHIALEVPGTEQSNEWCEPVDDTAYAEATK